MIPQFRETSKVSDLLMEPSAEALFAGSFSPVPCADLMGIEALRLGPQPLGNKKSIDWGEVHTATQVALEPLWKRIVEVHPEAVAKVGRTSSRSFPLFTYQTYFRLDGDDYDPVIVGVGFDPAGEEIVVSGDISGEESGDVYFDEGCSEVVAGTAEAVAAAASRVASRLVSQSAVVLQAIQSRQPQALPG
jgi:hypothetical protein